MAGLTFHDQGKGEEGMTMGLEHLQHKLRSCGFLVPVGQWEGCTDAAQHSSDVIPKTSYLQVLYPPGNRPFPSLASSGCEGNREGPSSQMPLAA